MKGIKTDYKGYKSAVKESDVELGEKMKVMAEGAEDIKVEMRQFNLITMDSLVEGQRKIEERKRRKR